MCAGEKAAAAVMPIVQRSVWSGAILFKATMVDSEVVSIAKNNAPLA